MDVRWVLPGGVERHPIKELPALLAREDGFAWVDIGGVGEEQAAPVLREAFGFHPLAIRDCFERCLIPKVHPYADHLFLVLHAPEPGAAGRVHHLELGQFVGRRYLVTIHAPPAEEGFPHEVAHRETRAVLERLEAGRLRPRSPAELAYAIVSALIRRMEAFVAALAAKVATLERRVIQGELAHPERLLEEMFLLRHELLATRTVAAQDREVVARAATLAPRFMPPEERLFLEDLVDRFDRTRSLCDGEKDFLQGVIDFYATRTTTKMNIAMERLALMTAVVLPITALASIYGMNVIVNDRTRPYELVTALAAMAGMTVVMLRWAKRQGWW
jgi:magnesium transporter